MPYDDELTQSVSAELFCAVPNAALDADDLYVITACNGTVTIDGVVSSWAEHDEAIDAAWSIAGVTAVNDHMTIAY